MSLPWHKASTAAILGLRQNWTRADPIPEALALVELGALAVSGMLVAKSQTRLASEWGWGRGRMLRNLRAWKSAGFLDYLGEPEVNIRLPSWWTGVFEESRKDAPTREPEVNRKRTGPEPRARSSLKEGEEEGENPQTPKGAGWAVRASKGRGVKPAEVEAAACAAVAAITQKPRPVKGAATAVRPFLALWKALEHPDLSGLVDQVALVAEAARDSAAPLFARDVRGEGWAGAVDRSRSVATLCVQARWDERLTAAEEWKAGAVGGRRSSGAPWDDPPAPGVRPVAITDAWDAEAYLRDYAGDLADARQRIRAAGGGWPELAAYLRPRVSDPDLILNALRVNA